MPSDGVAFWREQYAIVKGELDSIKAVFGEYKTELFQEKKRLDWAIRNPGRFTVVTNHKVRGLLTERESIDKVMKDEYDHIR